MPLIVQVIIFLAVVGVLIYLFNTFVTMDGRFKNAINALVGLLVFLVILDAFFNWGWFPMWQHAAVVPIRKGC